MPQADQLHRFKTYRHGQIWLSHGKNHRYDVFFLSKFQLTGRNLQSDTVPLLVNSCEIRISNLNLFVQAIFCTVQFAAGVI